jgi:hypothetical protein
MRTLSVTFAVAVAILLVSSLAWNADAQTSLGAANISAQSQNFSPIQPAACGRPGGYCPAGSFRRCNYNACWCSRCDTLYSFGYSGPYRWGYRVW